MQYAGAVLNYCVTVCLGLVPQCKSYHINIASIFTIYPTMLLAFV